MVPWTQENSANAEPLIPCLLYTSDAADEEDSVDLGGRRIIKKAGIPYTEATGLICRIPSPYGIPVAP